MSQIAASFSTSQNTHQDISPLTEDGADPAFVVAAQQLGHDIPDDPDFTHLPDDWTWTNDSVAEHHFANDVLEDMTFSMSGALPISREALSNSDGVEVSQSVNGFNTAGLELYIAPEQSNITEATLVAGDQPYSASANGPNLSKQLSLRTSMSSNEPMSDPSWQAAYHGVDQIDSAMELCDTPNSAAPGTEKLTSFLAQSLMPRGISKQPVRSARAHQAALNNALKRIEKLTVQVDELRTKTKGLRLDN